MAELLNGWKRTHYCTEPGEDSLNSEVLLMGWVDSWRNLGSLIFIGLRDRTGVMQLVFDSGSMSGDAFAAAETLRNEYVIAVKGKLVSRAPEMVNAGMETGRYEVMVDDLKILASAQTPPIYVDDDSNTQEQIRLKYRYLDLRRPYMQHMLKLRSEVTRCARAYYAEQGFIDIETPTLIKSTPEGARDYLVPSRIHPGKFYALPQSPQIFKQLLMLSGFDKYFQIARCYRDEDLRADRQPEFTQIDLEMSFVDVDDVIAVNEGFIKRLMKTVLDIDVELPLRRITYAEAMDRFGSDKPDTRFGLELVNISDIVSDCGFGVFTSAVNAGGSVRCTCVPGGAAVFSRKGIDELERHAKTYRAKGLAWMSLKPEGMQCSFAKFLTEEQIAAILERAGASEGDLLLFVADAKNTVVFASLGALRLEIGRRMKLIDESRYDLLWVVEFPLLEWSDDESRFTAMHHPFTSPMDEDLQYLDTDPGRVRAKAYDIVLNGNEIGGGSIRIHSVELQEKMLNLLGFTKEEAWKRFGYLIEAFKYGTPPHGGLAYGLDRLTMLLGGSNNIRDVIAFPKVQNASCLMSESPSFVDQTQLDELSIAVTKREEEE